MGFSPLFSARLQTALCCFVLLFGLSLGTGCAPETGPDLLELENISPSSIERGSELKIEGNGFPEHRPGTLSLEGTLSAPGKSPRKVRWSLRVHPETRSTISQRIDAQQIEELLQGSQHGTLRARARLVFDPIIEGRPALRGSLQQVTLDFFAEQKSQADDGLAFSSFLGVKLSQELTVEKVEKDSPAALSGLLPGDRLHSLDGVHLDSFSDFIPTPHSRVSVIELTRQGESDPLEAHIERSGFQIFDSQLSEKALAIAAAIGAALLMIARPPRFLVWLLGPKTRVRRARVLWLEGVQPSLQPLAYLGFVAVIGSYFWLIRSAPEMVTQLDFLLTLGAGLLLLMLSSFVLGGKSSRKAFSFLGAVAASLSSAWMLLPLLFAALCRASELGSLQLSEIVDSQGALPQDWGAFQSPWAFTFSLCFIIALTPLAGRRAPLEGSDGPSGQSLLWGRALEWLGFLILLGLFAQLFLGGGQGGLESAPSWAPGVILCAKVALMAQGICWLRTRSGNLRRGESWSLLGVGNALLCVFSLLLFALSWFSPAMHVRAELLGIFSLSWAGALLLLAGISSTRSWAHAGRRSDPWI